MSLAGLLGHQLERRDKSAAVKTAGDSGYHFVLCRLIGRTCSGRATPSSVLSAFSCSIIPINGNIVYGTSTFFPGVDEHSEKRHFTDHVTRHDDGLLCAKSVPFA